MTLLNTITVLFVLTALFGFINSRTLRLPTTVGIMLIALCFSLATVIASTIGIDLGHRHVRALLAAIDFREALLDCMLAFLLFAGALHIRLPDLDKEKWQVGLLSTVTLLLSTVVIGLANWWLLAALGLATPFIYCLLFGALISPTDPVAVLGILKTARIPRSLEIKIAGESLFNDGVGVVVFIALLASATSGKAVEALDVVRLFCTEAIGGVLLGGALGFAAYWMLKLVNDYEVEIIITLALVMGGYQLANHLHLSGALAVVVAGLYIGNHGRERAMSETTRVHVDTFWHLVDGILNALLFLLIGLEVQVMEWQRGYLLAGGCSVLIVLFARWVSVAATALLTSRNGGLGRGAIRIMTWSGLRGGISVALALSLPPVPARELFLVMTYAVVVFSVFGQGLTLGRLVRSIHPDGEPASNPG